MLTNKKSLATMIGKRSLFMMIFPFVVEAYGNMIGYSRQGTDAHPQS